MSVASLSSSGVKGFLQRLMLLSAGGETGGMAIYTLSLSSHIPRELDLDPVIQNERTENVSAGASLEVHSLSSRVGYDKIESKHISRSRLVKNITKVIFLY